MEKERIVLDGFNEGGGKHCCTTALKNVLSYHGLHLSEEMLFGLGGGVGFFYWSMKNLPSPIIATRYGKGPETLVSICRRIGGDASIFETGSASKGYEELKNLLRAGEPAYVFVDMAYLPYLALPGVAHFGGHAVVVYGIDEYNDRVYIADCAQKGVTASVEDVMKARNSRYPPMPPKNKILEIRYPSRVGDLRGAITESIRESCANMLHPPIKNIGLAGIKKWADIVPEWPQQVGGLHFFGCLLNTFIYIEVSGTGGGAFRLMYAQFLRESSSLLHEPQLKEAAELYEASATRWSAIAAAALPDSWPALKKTRELSYEKNRIFREQNPWAVEKMKEINGQLDDLMGKAVKELEERDVSPLLSELQQKILECCEAEERAVKMLDSIVG